MDKRKLEDLLDKLQIPINTKGYKYWITAVEKYIANRSLNKSALYKEIAKDYDSTASRVERALRHAYEGKHEIIKEYFNIDYDISNSVFLELLSREMERQS